PRRYGHHSDTSPHHLHHHLIPTRRSSDLFSSQCHCCLQLFKTTIRCGYRQCCTQFPPGKKMFRQKQVIAHLLLKNIIGTSLQYRSEEHTSELQSRENLVCRLLLEKNNKCT